MRYIRVESEILRTETNKKKPVSDPAEIVKAVLNEKEHVMYPYVVTLKGTEGEEIISPLREVLADFS
jgi:hypothetical protein